MGDSDAHDASTERLVGLAEATCEDCSKQYEDYLKTFFALDSKAQTAGTVSGISIASVVAFIKPDQVSSLIHAFGFWGYVLLAVPALTAPAGVLFGVYATRLRLSPVPFGGEDRFQELMDLDNVSRG